MFKYNNKKFFNSLNLFLIIIFLIYVFSFYSLKTSFKKNLKEARNDFPENFLFFTSDTKNNFTNFFVNIANYFLQKKYFNQKIAILEEEIERQREIILKNKISEDENDSLNNLEIKSLSENENPTSSTLLNKKKIKNKIQYQNLISTKRIFDGFLNLYDVILINKGFIDEVEVGDLVFIYPNKIIGQIFQINKNNSLVSLFSKEDTEFEGILKVFKNTKEVNKDLEFQNILVDVIGIGNGDFKIEIPSNLNVEIGTKVYLAKDDTKEIGKVLEVKNKDKISNKEILVEGYYNSRINEKYYILLKNK